MRAQSSFEFLLTHLWAFMIIAIVMSVLVYLGIFNTNTLVPSATSGSCYVMRPNGAGSTQFIKLIGTCTGQLPQYVAMFNGQSSQITISSSSTLKPKSITVSVWVNVVSFPASGHEMHFVENYANSNGFVDDVYGSDSSYFFFDTPTRYTSNFGLVGAGWNLNTWVNYVASYDQSTGTITQYVNGKQQTTGSAPANQPITYSSSSLIIGGGASNTAYNGLMSNVQIYNVSLNAAQVLALYNSGIGGAPVNLQYLAGWWPLNGDVNDYSGNLNNGAASSLSFTTKWTNGYTVP